MKKRIGIFGGSFDPVHADHVNMCLAFARVLGLDKTIVVPAKLSPFKATCFATPEDRYKMLELAFSGLPVEISRFELDSDSKNYTYSTVEKYRKQYPSCDLFFLLGADSLASFPAWKNPERIASAATVCVVGRNSENLEESCRIFSQKFGYMPVIVDFCGSFSSTEIRERIALGLPVNDMLSPDVRSYVRDRGLYSSDTVHAFLRKNLTEKRLLHTLGVYLTAIDLAKKNGADLEKVKLAALLHDCAKYLKRECYVDFSCESDCPENVVHQFLGAYVAENILGIKDEEVLDAVRWHTTGRPDMTIVGKTVFVADLLEPARTFDGVNELRNAVNDDFEKGFRRCVRELLIFLRKQGSLVYRATIETDRFYNGV